MSITLIFLLIRLLIAAPDIYRMVRELIKLLRGIKNQRNKAHFEERIEGIVRLHLGGKRTVSDTKESLADLRSSIESELRAGN